MTTDAREVGMKRIFYHGGVPGLPVGGYILPALETGNDDTRRKFDSISESRFKKAFGVEKSAVDMDDFRDLDRVYVTNQLHWATKYAAQHSYSGWVYVVEPEGKIEEDPDEVGWSVGSFICSRARIVSRIYIPPHRLRLLQRFQREDPLNASFNYYFWLLDNDEPEALPEPPPGLSRLKREMWLRKARKGTLREAA